MNFLFKHITGDKVLWGMVAFMCLLSFLPVYSASSNLQYVVNNGTTVGHLIKHTVMVCGGLLVLTYVPRIEYKWFGNLSAIMLTLACVLLIITLAQGTVINGANASRWLIVPILGVSFQTSTLANLALLIYVARYLHDFRNKQESLRTTILRLWLPIVLVVILIFPANFSTAALVFLSVVILLIIGGYSFRYLGSLIGLLFIGMLFFVLIAKAFPSLVNNRVDTWESRIESFMDKDQEESYQVRQAKIAIATGGLAGLGPGKSVQKNFLPQSSSDFIFAIIIEEYGILGGGLVMLIYLVMLQRFVVIARRAKTVFGSLLVIGLGAPIIIQALLNMMVATNLVPVTGQTLPFVSSGGTSLWITCAALGIILSVSAAQEKESMETNIELND